jgi:hypothetical protein
MIAPATSHAQSSRDAFLPGIMNWCVSSIAGKSNNERSAEMMKGFANTPRWFHILERV